MRKAFPWVLASELIEDLNIQATKVEVFIDLQCSAIENHQDPVYSRGKKDTPAYNNSLCKWGHFEKAKTTFKMLPASWTFDTIEEGNRSFNAENLRSKGQRAAKLPAIKLRMIGAGQASNRGRMRLHTIWVEWPKRQTFSWELQLWQLVTLQPFDL